MTMIENPVQEVPTRHGYNKKVIAALVAALIGVTVIIGLLVNRGDDHSLVNSLPSNYLTDTSLLETDVQSALQDQADEADDSSQVTDVTCVKDTKRKFICVAEWDTYNNQTIYATVSADGQHFVTDTKPSN